MLSRNKNLIVDQLEHLILAYNDIQDRLYEIDKSWKNNLIFYGIPAGKIQFNLIFSCLLKTKKSIIVSNPVMFLTGCPPVSIVFLSWFRHTLCLTALRKPDLKFYKNPPPPSFCGKSTG
jgi:hypothetical protein